ncbi:hypothetical protein ACJ6WE_19855 [Streptomyces sp. MMS24-I31]|uniref:hypothetical protein n=1 Tax=Streptomyces sp. MMS24-I31 TaxID=3351563 RepID=UPI003896A593
MKKFINAPETVLAEALSGIAAAHAGLRVDAGNGEQGDRPRLGAKPGKVALVPGGGSGHEPLRTRAWSSPATSSATM